VHFLHTGLSPIRTLAKEDFPTPVAPRMTMCGRGRSFYGRKKKYLTKKWSILNFYLNNK